MTDYTESRSIIEVLRSRIAASGADGFGVVSRVPIADLKALIDAAERTEKADAERDEARAKEACQESRVVFVRAALEHLLAQAGNVSKGPITIEGRDIAYWLVQLGEVGDYTDWKRRANIAESALQAANTRIAALEEGLREAISDLETSLNFRDGWECSEDELLGGYRLIIQGGAK